jgi:hypothetical protein
MPVPHRLPEEGEAEATNKGVVRGECSAGWVLTLARETGGGPVRCGRGAEDGDARSACPREEDEGGAHTSARKRGEGRVGRPKATGSACRWVVRGRGEVGSGWVKNQRWAKVQKQFLFEFQLILEFGRTLEIWTRRFRKKFDMGIFPKIF